MGSMIHESKKTHFVAVLVHLELSEPIRLCLDVLHATDGLDESLSALGHCVDLCQGTHHPGQALKDLCVRDGRRSVCERSV